jgi:hypothetical protein
LGAILRNSQRRERLTVLAYDLEVDFRAYQVESGSDLDDGCGHPSKQNTSDKRPWDCPREYLVVILDGDKFQKESQLANPRSHSRVEWRSGRHHTLGHREQRAD